MTQPRADADPSALARREQILEAARATIDEHGPGALTGLIAKRAGLARPNFYRHFSSKDELDLAVARSAYQELRAEIRKQLGLCGTPTPLDVIHAPIAAQVTWADSHKNLYRFLVSRGHQRSSRQSKAARGDFAAELAAAAGRYFPPFAENPDSAEMIHIGLIGLVDASVIRWLSHPAETREELIERLTTHSWLIIDHHLHEIGFPLDPAVPLPRAPAGR